MIKLLLPIPMEVYIAFSGGVDSMAVAHFLQRGGRKVHLLHFDHGCEYSEKIKQDCVKFATQYEMDITIGSGESDCPRGQSLEEFWRRQRYRWLRNFSENIGCKFITCHHIDDAMETSIITLLNTGESKLIPLTDRHVYRPFLTTKKEEFSKYAEKHNLPIVVDPYNNDMSKQRNYIRHNIIPHVLKTHPGYYKVLRKKYERTKQAEIVTNT